MATEIRRLIFSHEETLEAIVSHTNKTSIMFPEGKIVRATLVTNTDYKINSLKKINSALQKDYHLKDNDRLVTLTIFCEETLEQRYFNLTATFISTALIEYCIKHKIMIPKDAEKELALTDFNICLDISKDNFTDKDTESNRFVLAD